MTMSSAHWGKPSMNSDEQKQTGGLGSAPSQSKGHSASTIVQEFLQAVENRNLDQAHSFLAVDFQMTFPGNTQFTKLEELVAWGKSRYTSISKSYDGFDEFEVDWGAIVYCRGTLSGTLPNGAQFNGIRFIDRFEVRDGKLCDQQVWNDLAELLNSR